jgi:hypothetical protein
MKNIKIQEIEFTEKELWTIYNAGKTILVKFRNAYQLEHGKNVGFHAIHIYRHYGDLPMVPKGQHLWVDEVGLKRLK